jgi:hypothetical protein
MVLDPYLDGGIKAIKCLVVDFFCFKEETLDCNS